MIAYITPHAISRLQERVDRRLDEAAAAELIGRALAAAMAGKPGVRRDGKPTLTLRAKGLRQAGKIYEFRLVLVPAAIAGNPPVVATVLAGSVRRPCNH